MTAKQAHTFKYINLQNDDKQHFSCVKNFSLNKTPEKANQQQQQHIVRIEFLFLPAEN